VRFATIFGGRRNRAARVLVQVHMDFSVPFRGSVAVASGLLTRAVLTGPRFRRVFPDVYVRADVERDLALLSMAGLVFVGEEGVLGGYSAAELLGASCAPLGAPAEVIVPDGAGRRRVCWSARRRCRQTNGCGSTGWR
jgi:hypothetical protein